MSSWKLFKRTRCLDTNHTSTHVHVNTGPNAVHQTDTEHLARTRYIGGTMESIFAPPSYHHELECKVEDHRFYTCIHPLLIMMKLVGGRIHRVKQGILLRDGKYQAFKIYCFVWVSCTVANTIRSALIFDNITFDQQNLLKMMMFTFFVAISINQIYSFFKFKHILPILDKLVTPLSDHIKTHYSLYYYGIRCLLLVDMMLMMSLPLVMIYHVMDPNPDPLILSLAYPWSEPIATARISYISLMALFGPSHLLVTLCLVYFMIVVKLLRVGFKDVYSDMVDAQSRGILHQIIQVYKRRHLLLVQVTEEMDCVLGGYIGPAMFICVFHLCLVVYTIVGSDIASYGFHMALGMLATDVCCMFVLCVGAVTVHTEVSRRKICKGVCLELNQTTEGSIGFSMP